jgi:serine protease Do
VLAAGWVLWRRTPAPPRSESATVPAAAPPASAALSSRELARRSLPSTVALRCHDSVGSGFFAAPDFVLTNAHVLCSAGEAIEAVLSDGRRLPATVVRSNQVLDLALLRVDGAGVAPLPLGDVAELSVGDRVQIIGSPAGLEFTVHEGSVSSLHRPVQGVAYVQLDAKINPGNSGGPIIDDRGRVVGVVTLKHRSADGIGLALPINYAYSEPLRLLSPPDAGAQDSAPFQAMVARARSARDEGEPAFDGRPLLVAASVDRYQRLVVRVLRVSAGPPRLEEIALKFWSGTEAFCTVKGDVSSWTLVEPDRAESIVDPRLLQVVRERAGDRYVYVGESPLRWDLCDRDRMGPGVEVELVGASPVASRMKLLN